LAISKLGRLQLDFLNAFFKRETRFFLTGRAALVGFHLRHRETHDLDLFTLEDTMADGYAVVGEVAREMGATQAPDPAPVISYSCVASANNTSDAIIF
jgi:hypothetical protein